MIMIIMKSGICRAFVPDTGCGVTQWFAFGGEICLLYTSDAADD